MPFTKISPDEFSIIVQVASNRAISALKKNLKDSVNRKRDWVEDLEMHVKGVVGEYAAAKVLGIPFTGSVDTFKSETDLSGNIEVRFRSNPTWDLIVRPTDGLDNKKVVLVRGLPPGAVEVAGWIWGREAKREEWWKNHGNLKPAWWVPAEALRPMEEIFHE